MSAILEELAEKVAAGKSKLVPGLVQDALDAGRHDPCDFCVEQ